MTVSILAREAPAPEPLHRWLDDPSHPAVPNEPLLDIDNIQGNILGGFNKDYQALLCLEIEDVAPFRQWLGAQVPFIASSAEVLAFNRLFKALRYRRSRSAATPRGQETAAAPNDPAGVALDREPGIKATWVNIAFSYHALRKLTDNTDLALTASDSKGHTLSQDFVDEAFKQGMWGRASELGDPTNGAGEPRDWKVGGKARKQPDVLLIVASDDRGDLGDEVGRLLRSLRESGSTTVLFPTGLPDLSDQALSRLRELFAEGQDSPELGVNPPTARGHEHFGFLDGVSQPGLRGRLSNDPHDVLTPRQNPNDRDQGKPGQDLLWPGEFVFGYPKQKAEGPVSEPGPLSTAGPEWARNGSFLVFRRLEQDVHAFHEFLFKTAEKYSSEYKTTISPDLLGSRLVGRWRSGAPVLRAPRDDNEDLGGDDCANNHFEFQEESGLIPMAGVQNPFDCVDDRFPQSGDDREGRLCPFAGHIRKVYPRDDESEDKVAHSGGVECDARRRLNEADTQTHRLLRRGIPFGPASKSTPAKPAADDTSVERGLYFLAYQTSIVDQFEFVMKCWANNPDFKEPGAGYDPIIGQNNAPDGNRKRQFRVILPGRGEEERVTSLTADTDWVIPTGGGYFFSPSICTLERLSKPPATQAQSSDSTAAD